MNEKDPLNPAIAETQRQIEWPEPDDEEEFSPFDCMNMMRIKIRREEGESP